VHDVELSILRPQFDPLVGELISRLLQKTKWRPRQYEEDEPIIATSYEVWNTNLAKKFQSMFKNYKKYE
jgi:hypothetical protein